MMTDPTNGELAEALERVTKLADSYERFGQPELAADLRTLLSASRLRSGMTRERVEQIIRLYISSEQAADAILALTGQDVGAASD